MPTFSRSMGSRGRLPNIRKYGVINYWTTRMNILCGNSLGSKTNEDVRMYI